MSAEATPITGSGTAFSSQAVANAVSAMSASFDDLHPNAVARYAPGDNDVCFDIKFCGVCHTDVHYVKNDLNLPLTYPLTPGHEFSGVVTAVGADVRKVKVGDKVAVGCMVDACLSCDPCRRFEEQYCENGMVGTYGSTTRYGRAGPDFVQTAGGYSDKMVVNDRFVFKVPDDADLAKVAPLLCCGITTFEPLVRFGCAPDAWQFTAKTGKKKVGVAGIGGLGHMTIKIANSFSCEVTAISTSPAKEPEARAMGAERFVVSTDAAAMKEASEGPTALKLDLILDTVSAPHDLMPYMKLLANDGMLVLIGLTTKPFALPSNAIVFTQKVIRGSLIGGTARTHEMLNYCCKHDIFPTVKVIDASEISDTLKLLDKKNDHAVRYVIDCSTIPKHSPVA